MLRKWSLDDQCQKSVVFVVATEDRLFWAARDQKVPVYAAELTQIYSDQVSLALNLCFFFFFHNFCNFLKPKFGKTNFQNFRWSLNRKV